MNDSLKAQKSAQDHSSLTNLERAEVLRGSIVENALSLIDTPYRWNSVQPYEGSHCAMFGLTPYKLTGLIDDNVKLPVHHRDWMLGKDVDPNEFRDFIMQFAVEIPFDDRQSGDLVSFIFRGIESHVGILLRRDPDHIIHNPSGEAVKVQRLAQIPSLKSVYRHKKIMELENVGS